MGIINWLKENKKKEQEKRKRYLESLPKCKYCKEPYLEELIGPNDFAHRNGFCCEIHITMFVLKEIKQIKEKAQHNQNLIVDRLDFVYEKAVGKDFKMSFDEFRELKKRGAY